MLRRFGAQLDRWSGRLALFLVLATGTAYAANEWTGENIVDGSLTSADYKNNDVRSVDLANDTTPYALTGLDIKNDSMGGHDVINNDLTGADIDESTLGQVPSARLGGFGRTGTNTGFQDCDPESTAFLNCALTGAINVPVWGARALVFGHVQAQTEIDSNTAYGQCRLGTSTVGPVPNTTTPITVVDGTTSGFDDEANVTVIGISPPLPPGPTNFGIDCNQRNLGAIQYESAVATAVLINP